MALNDLKYKGTYKRRNQAIKALNQAIKRLDQAVKGLNKARGGCDCEGGPWTRLNNRLIISRHA